MTLSKEVITDPALWNKNRQQQSEKTFLLQHNLKLFEAPPSSFNQRIEAHNSAKNIQKISMLFYLPGLLALTYLVFVF